MCFLRVVVGERHFACNFPCMNYPMYFNFWNLLISLPEGKQEKLKKKKKQLILPNNPLLETSIIVVPRERGSTLVE